VSDAAGHDLRASVHSSYFQGMRNVLLTGGRTLADALREYNSFLVDQPAGALSSISVTAVEVQCCGWNWGGPPAGFPAMCSVQPPKTCAIHPTRFFRRPRHSPDRFKYLDDDLRCSDG
jgi:hypothetical protein